MKTTGPNLKVRVDKLASEYENLSSRKKELERSTGLTADAIKGLAENNGEKVGKQVICTGHIYEAGYTQCEPSYDLNQNRARLRLPASVVKYCLTTVISKEKLQEAIDKKMVTEALVAACYDETKPGQKRIYVKKLSDKKEDKPDEQGS